MVGLRWNSYVDGGHLHWAFVLWKREGGRPAQRRIFWAALFIAPVIWAALLGPSYLVLGLKYSVSKYLVLG